MENNFENNIKATLEGQPFIPFDEAAWKSMERQLNTPNNKKFWTTAKKAFILGLLILGFGIYIGRWSNSSAIITSKQLIIIDTLIQKHQTIIYDTVYSSIVNHRSSANKKYAVNSTYNKTNRQASNLFYHQHTRLASGINTLPLLGYKNTFLYHDTNSFAISKAFFSLKKKHASGQKLVDKPQVVSKIKMITFSPLLPNNERPINQKIVLQPNIFTQKSFASRIDNIIPEHFGLFTKFSIQHDFGLSSHDDKLASRFHQGGVEVYINRHLSITAALGNHLTIFDKEKDDNEAVNLNGLPTPLLEGVDHFIHSARGKFDLELFAFGANYHFRVQKKMQLYFGLGLYATSALDAKIDYTIKRPGNGFYEIQLDDLLSDKFKADAYWLQLGTSYNIRKHWTVFLDINSRLGLKASDYKYENPKALGLNLGLGYYW